MHNHTEDHGHAACCPHHHTVDDSGEGPVFVHAPADFDKMRVAGQLASETLDFITPYVQPGITTGELDRLCHDFIVAHGAIPAPLGYHDYPKSICTSVNHVVCHGIPGDKKLEEGYSVNIDVTVIVDGWHGDTSRMFPVGKIPLKARRLIDVTHEALWRAIDKVKPGCTLGDIGHTIQSFVESYGFSVVRDYCGHGIGRIFHAPPSVAHFGKPGTGLVLQEGMFFTIEPMVNQGGHGVKVLSDGWTVVTKDRSLSAQFEHTLGVTATGCEIFTQSAGSPPRPLEGPPADGP